eukprot:TRINITY_DN8425_c0_g2_i1.p1 TRINITY_DN8425_c0_g2~~TRINITY_DN8425_c0_g2_i1.p1  ORF type:complete len:447 (+),score=116.84 TRINITY_DN8425_c0_g2_i1:155-1342(+)
MESHSTEVRAYATIRVTSLEMQGPYEILLDKENSTMLKSTHSIIVASYGWKSTDPTNGYNIWNLLLEEHDIDIHQLALNNPTYKDAITEHRPEEMLYVLGSVGGLPFLKKLNASDGASIWMKHFRPTLSESMDSLGLSYFQIDSIQFYRTVVAIGGRVQLSYSPKKRSPVDLMQSPPFSISIEEEEELTQAARKTSSNELSAQTSKFSFIATIPQTYVNSETKTTSLAIEPQTFMATNFASMDSATLISSDVTNDIALFVVSLATLTPSSHRFEIIDNAKQNTPNEPSSILYMGRTTWRATSDSTETIATTPSNNNKEEESITSSFFDMMLRVHHHHPDWETRMGLKGASSSQVFLAFLLCVGYIALVIGAVRWIRRNFSAERMYSVLPPPAFAS